MNAPINVAPRRFESGDIAVVGIRHGFALAAIDGVQQHRHLGRGPAWGAGAQRFMIGAIHHDDVAEIEKIVPFNLPRRLSGDIDAVLLCYRNGPRIRRTANMKGRRSR